MLRALRANLAPGLFLQGLALLVLLLYQNHTGTRAAFDALGVMKREGGVFAAVVTTALFGGLLPYLFLLASGRVPRGQQLPQLLFYVAFWGYKGFEIDWLYRMQAEWFGNEATFQAIASKTLVDQMVYGPLWAAPTQTLLFLWKDAGFSISEAQRRLELEPLGRRFLTVLTSNWVVWIPAVAIVYALPVAIQLLLSNLVLVFWTLILTFVSENPAAPAPATD